MDWASTGGRSHVGFSPVRPVGFTTSRAAQTYVADAKFEMHFQRDRFGQFDRFNSSYIVEASPGTPILGATSTLLTASRWAAECYHPWIAVCRLSARIWSSGVPCCRQFTDLMELGFQKMQREPLEQSIARQSSSSSPNNAQDGYRDRLVSGPGSRRAAGARRVWRLNPN